jgi:hypothetical protein
MSEVKSAKRWIFSIGLVVAVLAIAIVLILVLHKPANRGSNEFQVVGDLSGGIFLSWWDRGNGDVHLQHVNNQGGIL